MAKKKSAVEFVAVGTPRSIIGSVVKTDDNRIWLYVTRLPKRGDIPRGMVLAHNPVWPASRRPGVRGSRWWFEVLNRRLRACSCGAARDLGRHYCYAKTPSADVIRKNREQLRREGERV